MAEEGGWDRGEDIGGKQEKLQHRGRVNNDRGEESCWKREKDPMCLLPAAKASACKVSNLIS